MLGAILFARNLKDFDRLGKKTVRIVQYSGTGRSNIQRQIENAHGYAIQYEEDIRDISLLLPTEQRIENGLMVPHDTYPEEVIRELLANALIHQDLTDPTRYVTVEIFDGRIEFTNPGNMVINRLRIIDWPSESRNLYVPGYMREMSICEEMGSGWDRIVTVCESKQLPAPRLEDSGTFTRVTLFGRTEFADLTKDDRLWACYLHACSQHTNGKRMTNASLRARFGLGSESTVTVSRILRTACDQGLIRVFDENSNPRSQSYVPFWA